MFLKEHWLIKYYGLVKSSYETQIGQYLELTKTLRDTTRKKKKLEKKERQRTLIKKEEIRVLFPTHLYLKKSLKEKIGLKG